MWVGTIQFSTDLERTNTDGNWLYKSWNRLFMLPMTSKIQASWPLNFRTYTSRTWVLRFSALERVTSSISWIWILQIWIGESYQHSGSPACRCLDVKGLHNWRDCMSQFPLQLSSHASMKYFIGLYLWINLMNGIHDNRQIIGLSNHLLGLLSIDGLDYFGVSPLTLINYSTMLFFLNHIYSFLSWTLKKCLLWEYTILAN
jgi:hypothetical protein